MPGKRIASLIVAVFAFASLGATATVSDALAKTSGGVGGGAGNLAQWCGQYQTLRAGRYLARNDVFSARYGKRGLCLSGNGGPNFTVHSRMPHSNAVTAFPNIFLGCEWNICVGKLPARVSSLRNPMVTLHTAGHPASGYNASVESFYDTRPIRTGQANQAELMVWLRAPGWHDSSRRVKINHVWYYLATWYDPPGHAFRGSPGWNYIQFNRVHPVDSVTNLKLAPFIRYAEQRGWIHPRSYLLNIEGGFELRGGGNGLAVRYFAAQP